jgi:hypothetical protein
MITQLTLARVGTAQAPAANLGSQEAPAFSAQQLVPPVLTKGRTQNPLPLSYFAFCKVVWMYAVTSLSSSAE